MDHFQDLIDSLFLEVLVLPTISMLKLLLNSQFLKSRKFAVLHHFLQQKALGSPLSSIIQLYISQCIIYSVELKLPKKS